MKKQERPAKKLGVKSMDMSVWYLLGAVLVFFMQCGFAMVETGFTRAKNAGNIIMKNLMDFCIGTIVFFILGYGIMNSESYFFGLYRKTGISDVHRLRKL